MSKSLLGKKLKTYNLIKQLGEGAFATVFQGVDDNNENVVAVKAVSLNQLQKSKKLKQLVKTEINVLKQCNNENVIKYVDSFQTKEHLVIVTQFCNGGDLETYLAKSTKLTEEEAINFLKEILNGFKGLHEVGAMHRDFKVANVLLHNGVCKIADLGFAKQMEERAIARTILGTSVTMAPEVLQEQPYGFQADIWSIGVVFYQLLYGKFPYYSCNDFELLKKIKNNRPDYHGVNLSKYTRDFIDRCLTIDPKKRINWKQIYEHPLISSGNQMTFGKINSQIYMKKNRQFYEKNKLPERNTIQLQIQSAKQIVLQVLKEDQIRKTQNIQKLQKQASEKVLKEQNFTRLETLYFGRISDIMFIHKFIEPYTEKLQYVRINHSTALFILNKKSYIQLIKLYDSMVNGKNIFNIPSGFQQYTKTHQYKDIISQVKLDINSIKARCKELKQNIKLSTLEIQAELDLSKIKNPNYDSLTNELIRQYMKMLAEHLDCVTAENKVDILKVIQALAYYRGNPKPYSHEFERIILTADLEEEERKLRIKYPSKLLTETNEKFV